jgi:hypothetical protein
MAGLTVNQAVGFGFVVGAGVGATAAYFLTERSLRLKYNKIADDEIQTMKEHYREAEMNLIEFQEKIAKRPKPDLDKVVEELGYKQESQPVLDEVIEEAEEENVFDAPPVPPWNQDHEMAERNGVDPYVIHLEEFREDDAFDHQATFTYFEGDDVLIDDHDEVVMKRENIIGEGCLSRFGHGSGDPNVVYVRNPRLQHDYEILRHKGHYAKEILGLEEDPSIEHSAIPRRRQRFDDDS